MLPNDLRELLLAFNEHGVEYLLVGGYAVGVYAEPRATKDLDILIRPEQENSNAVYRAIAAYGAPLSDVTPADFCNDLVLSFRSASRPSVSISSRRSTVLRSTRRGPVGRRRSLTEFRYMSFPPSTSYRTNSLPVPAGFGGRRSRSRSHKRGEMNLLKDVLFSALP